MNETQSFIEQQFPVSKVSKESYKERKSSQGQTITGLGKWWGRKPLILVRATILGCLMPISENHKLDMEIFLKILSMDNDGLLDRKQKSLSVTELYDIASTNKHFRQYLNSWFDISDLKVKLIAGVDKNDIEARLFKTLGYDDKLKYCMRPEQLENLRHDSWNAINQHLGTSAYTLQDLVSQLSILRYGKNIVVGDCFSGGGSIPFEAARMGTKTYGSDLNPIASLLTWASVNVCGVNNEELNDLKQFQQKVYNQIDKEVTELGIEHNELGDRALTYLYCLEVKCPECGMKVPLLPSLVIGIRAGKVIACLTKNNNYFDITVKMNVSSLEMKEAENGTVTNNNLVCPHCGKTSPINILRHDCKNINGETSNELRKWDKNEFTFRNDDIYNERLYAIRYESPDGKRYYRHPNERDFQNEYKVKLILEENIKTWQDHDLIPNIKIESGDKTIEVIRNRGWTHWNHLFNARQLFILSKFSSHIMNAPTQLQKVVGILGLNKCADFGSNLCRWNPNCDKTEQTFYNQAYNTMMNWGVRSLTMLNTLWFRISEQYSINYSAEIFLKDARDVSTICNFWITDPPYADAVNYHELSEFFLAWDKKLIKDAFPEWYTDSKRILAVRGDEHFSQTMIEIYSNLTAHMPDNGMQVVMFTHSDPAVWAQLAIIMWKSGLKVTAAWNIATETEASGLKDGNYVKGTVLLVLRKQKGDDKAFLDEINSDIRSEVKKQISSMLALDNKEEPNFSDPDYVLAAYAASLKVITSYKSIEDLDLNYELNIAIKNPIQSKIVSIIENAKKIAYDCVIPLEFDSYLWKDLMNSEKFYIKGIESEKHNSYKLSTYQEFARGFSINGYSQLMASTKANEARLKTPFEMAGRSFNEVLDFEKSLLRIVFMGIYIGIKEDDNPQKALGYIKNEITNYWDKRDMIKQLLQFIADTKDITNMQPHWEHSAQMAEMLYTLVANDSI